MRGLVQPHKRQRGGGGSREEDRERDETHTQRERERERDETDRERRGQETETEVKIKSQRVGSTQGICLKPRMTDQQRQIKLQCTLGCDGSKQRHNMMSIAPIADGEQGG